MQFGQQRFELTPAGQVLAGQARKGGDLTSLPPLIASELTRTSSTFPGDGQQAGRVDVDGVVARERSGRYPTSPPLATARIAPMTQRRLVQMVDRVDQPNVDCRIQAVQAFSTQHSAFMLIRPACE